jgi:DtxR family Mn-dependent transcriptional regulator
MKNRKREKLTSSIEDYLETITILSEKNKVVRVKDISNKMKVSKPSVHSALHFLKENGYIRQEPYGYITLTKKGKIAGENIYEVHKILIKFFTEILKVKRKTAEKDACNIEHYISSETLKKLIKFIKNYF